MEPSMAALPRKLLPRRFEESPLDEPAAARRISISGATVSLLWDQNCMRDLELYSSSEYCWTPMSCRPASEFLVRVDR